MEAGVSKLEGGPRGATIRFYNDQFNKPDLLLDYITKQGALIKVSGTKLIFRRDWKRVNDKIRGAYAIVSDLAKLAST